MKIGNMDWVYTRPQVDNAFPSLGGIRGDDYMVDDRAIDVLNEINCKLSCEDKTLRTFRRAIGQNVKSDLLPFLINVKEHKMIDKIIRILVNLTVPVECLFSIEIMMRTEVGRHTINDLNALLAASKESFTDVRAIRAVVDHMKNILEKDSKLSFEQCDSVNNCLVLLRNILHIPESVYVGVGQRVQLSTISLQNQVVWNLFTLSIDKLFIYLMSCPQRSFWSVTIVQLIALMYKDQHVAKLQTLMNMWLEDSLSDSSEDFESNTSPPTNSNGDSSPMLTSDPTSDSSDNGGSSRNKVEETAEERRSSLPLNKENETTRKSSEYSGAVRRKSNALKLAQQMAQTSNSSAAAAVAAATAAAAAAVAAAATATTSSHTNNKNELGIPAMNSENHKQKHLSTSEQSDCGYGTQVENQESVSISSNEENYPCQKVHQKPPCNQKQRYNAANNPRSGITAQDKKDLRRKKLVKRSKSSLISMKGLLHHAPTDDDISNILKEFTVDFLLKGYGCLVQELHSKLLSESDLHAQIDTSHFFWLVTYFLKFAAQLELDLDHIKCVLSFKIISYLTYEGVSLYEQLELSSRRQGMDLKPNLRRMHLLVTAIREFLLALETYKKISHLSQDDVNYIRLLQLQISVTDDLKHLFILLIRNYNPAMHSRQYLQDLIVTNHILLLIPEGISQAPDPIGHHKLMTHIEQFATAEIMQQYGLLLENFTENGEYVNDCIFTMMHHIGGGDLGHVTTLFQPIILKTYSRIWEADYELCDDWCDLIEYVIHKFINAPQQASLVAAPPAMDVEMSISHDRGEGFCDDVWSQEEIDILYWYYEQSKAFPDTVRQIVKLFSDSGFKKSRISIIQQLLNQDIVTRAEYNDLMTFENAEYERNFKAMPNAPSSTVESDIVEMDTAERSIEKPTDDIQVLKEKLLKENKGKLIDWLQSILIECCFAKLCCVNNRISPNVDTDDTSKITIIEPVPHHCILKKQSVPVVPWNAEQTSILLYQPFILLLHKLGFHLPADVGKLFVRIPEFWTADILFNVAEKLGPIDKSTLKFDWKTLNGTISTYENTSNAQSAMSSPNFFALPQHAVSIKKSSFSSTLPPNWLESLMLSNASSLKHSHRMRDTKQAKSSSNKYSAAKHLPISSASNAFYTDSTKSIMTAAQSSNNMETDTSQMPYEMLQKSNEEFDNQDDADNNSETVSVTSDLTRMYVSDEEDRIFSRHRAATVAFKFD